MRKNEFDFEMYLESMSQMKKMGGLSSLMGMMPGLGLGGGKMPEIDTDEAEKNMRRIEAIIHSMTPQERKIRICSIQAERTALQEVRVYRWQKSIVWSSSLSRQRNDETDARHDGRQTW